MPCFSAATLGESRASIWAVCSTFKARLIWAGATALGPTRAALSPGRPSWVLALTRVVTAPGAYNAAQSPVVRLASLGRRISRSGGAR